MIRLAMLLLGARSIRRRWMLLPAVGALWMLVGALLIGDVSADGLLSIGIEALGVLLIVEGVMVSPLALGGGVRTNPARLARAIGFVVLGVLILRPIDHGVPDTLLFCLLFAVDGALRVASAWVVRFQRWRGALAAGVLELALAALVLADWPIAHTVIVPFSLGVALLASGWSLVRLGLQLRRLPPGTSITTLPLFASRPWHARPMLPGHVPHYDQPEPLVLYVWTPVGSAHDVQRHLLIDRYIAAVDGKGRISTGHSALEMRPDLYISHYPAEEIDHSPTDFARMLRAGHENDIRGRWLPSHAQEVADWCEPDARVVFPRYDAVALRAFWDAYRQDDTYNLTSRSCSTVTSLAIESALEGILASRWPWLWFGLLVTDPTVWLAAILRRRGATMAWTPGLVLDYARALQEVVERQHTRWIVRLERALVAWRTSRARSAR
jgi:uncharacterized membrane protein HdeD (DUF308 family)